MCPAAPRTAAASRHSSSVRGRGHPAMETKRAPGGEVDMLGRTLTYITLGAGITGDGISGNDVRPLVESSRIPKDHAKNLKK